MGKAYWGDTSDDWGTSMQIAAVHAYNINDMLNINDMGRIWLFDFICRNVKILSYSKRYHIASDRDCTGKCCGESLTFRKSKDLILIIRSASYDV